MKIYIAVSHTEDGLKVVKATDEQAKVQGLDGVSVLTCDLDLSSAGQLAAYDEYWCDCLRDSIVSELQKHYGITDMGSDDAKALVGKMVEYAHHDATNHDLDDEDAVCNAVEEFEDEIHALWLKMPALSEKIDVAELCKAYQRSDFDAMLYASKYVPTEQRERIAQLREMNHRLHNSPKRDAEYAAKESAYHEQVHAFFTQFGVMFIDGEMHPADKEGA